MTLYFDIYPGLVTTGWVTGCRLKGQSPFTLSLPFTHFTLIRDQKWKENKREMQAEQMKVVCVFNMSHPCPASLPGYSFYKDVESASLLPPLPAQKWNNSAPPHCIFVPFVQNGEAEKNCTTFLELFKRALCHFFTPEEFASLFKPCWNEASNHCYYVDLGEILNGS